MFLHRLARFWKLYAGRLYSTCWSVYVPVAAGLDCASAQKRSFLLVLDASNMQEVARAWTNHAWLSWQLLWLGRRQGWGLKFKCARLTMLR